MYSPPSSHKKQAVKQVLVYVGMTATVLTTVFLLVLFTLGYRFDRSARTIEQGGMVQLASIPSGAGVTINNTRISGTTSTKTTLVPGQHLVTMARNGYHNWQKTIDLKRGSILWLNYARLVPTELPVENVLPLSGVTSSAVSPNRKLYALTMEKSSPSVTLIDIESSAPTARELPLPEASYTLSEDPANTAFRVISWDQTNRYLLVEHTRADSKEWIVVDVEDNTKTKNINKIFDVDVSTVQFSTDNSRILYALMSGDVRRIDIEAGTISAPLARNVTEFSFYDKSTLIYTTAIDEATKSRSVSYLTEGAEKPRVVRRYSDDGTLPLHAIADKYYNQTFVALAYGDTVEILSGSLPRSDSDDLLSLTTISTISTKEPISHFSSRTDGRFFVAQHGRSYSVYDLELQKATSTVLRGEGMPSGELGWLDSYTVWSGLDGVLRIYEFDGANQHDIMPIIPGQVPAVTSNNRFLYAPTVDDSGAYHLSRVRLILQ